MSRSGRRRGHNMAEENVSRSTAHAPPSSNRLAQAVAVEPVVRTSSTNNTAPLTSPRRCTVPRRLSRRSRALNPTCGVALERVRQRLPGMDSSREMACAITAQKLRIPVAHVEAGIRSGDWSMPEEINRMVTDSITNYFFTTSHIANENLKNCGIGEERIFFVGNTMIDTLLSHLGRLDVGEVLTRYGVERGRYALLTLHRPSNVDSPGPLGEVLEGLEALSAAVRATGLDRFQMLFPVHPRTGKNLERFGLRERAQSIPGMRLLPPIPYPDFLALMSAAGVVLTDSGGIQEETTVLGVPCLTLRENTERPITVEQGTNVLVGRDRSRIVEEGVSALRSGRSEPTRPTLWDGHAAERIVDVLLAGMG